jgi:hypothetical protein
MAGARTLYDLAEHHAALNKRDAPTLMPKLAQREGMAAKALAFTIPEGVKPA